MDGRLFRENVNVKRVLAVLLVGLLLITTLIGAPTVSLAAEEEVPTLSGGEIQQFGEFDADIKVEFGTSEEDVIAKLNEEFPLIPATVDTSSVGDDEGWIAGQARNDSEVARNDNEIATVDNGVVGNVPVTWVSGDSGYDGLVVGAHEFVAVLPEGFSVAGNEEWIAGRARNDSGTDLVEGWADHPVSFAATPPQEGNFGLPTASVLVLPAYKDNIFSLLSALGTDSEASGDTVTTLDDSIRPLGDFNGVNTFELLQSAITNAVSGDTIHITDDIVMTSVVAINGKDLTFVSDGGSFKLYVSGNFRHFNLTNTTVDFSGLTMTRSQTLVDAETYGGGFNVYGAVTLLGGAFDNCGNGFGEQSSSVGLSSGGIFNMRGGSIINTTGCSAIRAYGGTINMYGGILSASGAYGIYRAEDINIYGGTITGCEEGVCWPYNSLHMSGGSIEKNELGIWSNEAEVYLSGGKIIDNVGYGGVYLTGWGDYPTDKFEISGDVLISGNSGPYGGVYLNHYSHDDGVEWIMSGGIIENNTITGGPDNSIGGGISVRGYMGTAIFKMTGGVIRNNTAVNGGGIGLFAESVKFIMTGGSIEDNTASNYGGGIYVRLPSVEANTINISGDANISGNIAGIDGGGICDRSYQNSTIRAIPKTIEDNVTIINNYAGAWGGGIYTPQYDRLWVGEDVVFLDNVAGYGGFWTAYADRATHDTYVKTQNLSSPFDELDNYPMVTPPYDHIYAYNNFDINYSAGTPFRPKTANPASGSHVFQEQEITYFIQLDNTARLDLTSYDVTDVVPDGVTLKANSISHGGTENDGTITWSGVNVPGGESLSVSFTGIVTADNIGASIINTAKIKNLTTNKIWNTNPVFHNVEPDKKTAIPPSGSTVNLGDEITYTIELDNSASNTYTGFEVIDVIPAGTTLVPDSFTYTGRYGTSGNPVLSGNTITWSPLRINGGMIGTVSFTVVVTTASTGTEINNVAMVDNVATNRVKHHVYNQKDADPMPGSIVDVGQEITYTIDLDNTDGSSQTDFEVTDIVPVGTMLKDGSITKGGTEDGGNITWPTINVGAGDRDKVSFTVIVTARKGADIENAAMIGGNATNIVKHHVDDIKKTAAPPSGSTVATGDEIIYTILLDNSAGSRTTAFTVTDEIPAGTRLKTISYYATFGTPTQKTYGNTLTWNLTILPKMKGCIYLTVIVTAETGAEINNIATIGGNKTNVVKHTVLNEIEEPEVALEKSAAEGDSFDEYDYTIVVENTGETALTGVEISDPWLKTGSGYATTVPVVKLGSTQLADGTDYDYDGSAGTITLDGGFAKGAVLTITYTTTFAVDGEHTNKAEVTTTEGVGDDDEVTVDVKEPKVALEKSATEGDSFDEYDYTIVVENTGETALTGVEVSDPWLKTGSGYATTTPVVKLGSTQLTDGTDYDYDDSAGTITLDGSFAKGAVLTITYTTTFDTEGEHTNKAEVTTTEGVGDDDEVTVDVEEPDNRIVPFVAAEVDKDTIRRTSAAYVSLPGKEGFDNVGLADERYRYDIDFRSTSNVPLDEFVVDDPLEAVTAGQIVLEELWTPVTWGDEDGKFYVLFKTNKAYKGEPGIDSNPSKQKKSYSNSGFRLWKAFDDSARRDGLTAQHQLKVSDLGLAKGEYVTALRFDFGAVAVGFTSKNYSDVSQNGEWRDEDGNIFLPTKEDAAKILGEGKGEGEDWIAGQAHARFAPYDRNVLDWRPDVGRADYAQGAADAQGLKPASYLVSAAKAMDDANIVTSVSAKVAKENVKSGDMDAVVTRVFSSFEMTPEVFDPTATISEDSFIDNAASNGVVIKGGKLYDAESGELLDGGMISKALGLLLPKTGDEMVFWGLVGFVLISGALLVMALRRRRSGKEGVL
ncbi:MAG: DUF11 domain-containing protein [Clostridiales Family XIII bacterium]|jgi:uncharacterized repeat protein (TIGR01451 family)/LPXTG-motif cell wall-anchored protein|nr:DUF11 domain-containing protein [Clostridiales Family XIII bacterium]